MLSSVLYSLRKAKARARAHVAPRQKIYPFDVSSSPTGSSSSESDEASSPANNELDVFLLPPNKSKRFGLLRQDPAFQEQYLQLYLTIIEDLDKELKTMLEKLVPSVLVFTASTSESLVADYELKMTELDYFVWLASEVIEHLNPQKPDEAYRKHIYREFSKSLDFVRKRVKELENLCKTYRNELDGNYWGLKAYFKSLINDSHAPTYRAAKLRFKEYKRSSLVGCDEAEPRICGELRLEGDTNRLKVWGAKAEGCGGVSWKCIKLLPLKYQKGLLDGALREIKTRANYTGPSVHLTLNEIVLNGGDPEAWKTSQFHLGIHKLFATGQYRNFPFPNNGTEQALFHWMKLMYKFERLMLILKTAEDVAGVTKKDLNILVGNIKILQGGASGSSLKACSFSEKIEKVRTVSLPLRTTWPQYLRKMTQLTVENIQTIDP